MILLNSATCNDKRRFIVLLDAICLYLGRKKILKFMNTLNSELNGPHLSITDSNSKTNVGIPSTYPLVLLTYIPSCIQCHSFKTIIKAQNMIFKGRAASCTTHSSPWLRSTRPTAMPCTKFLSFQINVRFLPSLLIMHTCSRCWKKWLVRAIYFQHIWYFFCISADLGLEKILAWNQRFRVSLIQ